MPGYLCIYCRAPLGPRTTFAHVIPSCLGGRLRSRTICCTTCNNAISPAENSLCSALREASVAVGARDGDNQPVHAEVTWNGKVYDYSDGLGEQRLPAPKYERGSLVFSLPGKPKEQAAVIAKQLWAARLTANALDDGRFRIEPNTTFNIQPHPPTPARLDWAAVLGTTEHMRVVMKMALELLAYVRPEDARRWGSLRDARLYVRSAKEEHPLPARFDALSEGSGILAAEDLPQLAHAVEVWTHRRNLNYRVTLFGGLHVTGPLATSWTGPAFSIAHGLDPTQPSIRLDRSASTDGASLGVYHPTVKQQTFDKFREWFLARTLEIAERVGKRPWAPPAAPDLALLRPLIDAEFAKLLKRKRQPKPKK